MVAWAAAFVPAAVGAESQKLESPAPDSPTFVAFTNEFDEVGTTQFAIDASSPDGSPLAYLWSMPTLPCGKLVDTATRGRTNGYFHGPTKSLPDGCPPPPGIEIDVVVQVLVIRTADLDSTGAPKAGAPYFVYRQLARAGDAPATRQYAKNESLTYYGGRVGTVERAPTPSNDSSGGGGSSTGLLLAGAGVLAVGGVTGTVVVRRRRRKRPPPPEDPPRQTVEQRAAHQMDHPDQYLPQWAGEYVATGEYSFVQGARQDLLNPDYDEDTLQIRRWIIAIYETAYIKYRYLGFDNLTAHAIAHIKVDEWRNASLDQFVDAFKDQFINLGLAISADPLGNFQRMVAAGVPITAIELGATGATTVAEAPAVVVAEGEAVIGTTEAVVEEVEVVIDEVEQVTAESGTRIVNPTRPNGAYLLANDEAGIASAMTINPKPGYFDVVAHGSPEGFSLKISGKWVDVTPKTMGDAIRKAGYKGGPIRLVACDTGQTAEGAAQQIADYFGETVEAPTGKVWATGDGGMDVWEAYHDGTKWVKTKPAGWKDFHPTLPKTPGS